eukprot:scaffold2111_cov130-Isochrysis_galbana.AAC.7
MHLCVCGVRYAICFNFNPLYALRIAHRTMLRCARGARTESRKGERAKAKGRERTQRRSRPQYLHIWHVPTQTILPPTPMKRL